jgi:tetratricopeptide (TPR) repeat protein
VEEGNKALAEMQREPPRDMSQVARVRLRLAMSFAERSQVKEANAELDRIAQLIGVPAARDAELEARYWYARAILAGDRLALAESLDDYRRAWALLQKLKAVPVDLAEQVELGMADLNNMTSHFAASEAQFRDLLGKQQARYGPTSARGCLTATGLARVLGNSGRVDEGVRIAQQSHDCLRAMLGPDSLRTSSAYDVLAGLYYQAGRYDEAGAIYEELAAVHARNEGPASLRALSDRQTAAAARQLAGHAAAAEQLFEKALADARKTMAESDPLVQTLRFHLADCRLDLRHGAGVPALLDGLSVTALNESEIETDWAARIAFERGRLALLQGDGAAARELLAKAQAGFAEPGGEGRFSAAAVRRALGAPGPN